ncbi:phosphomannomutase CpsG [Actibacterium lipolyticum]|uniref:Phosphomannomutase/phosphoglucomutase n=1 Tax=Actibacterium lipolyticum TaxID=1524263 RepID=A0A238KRR7_9RHOB|nr:phosphomannomutase CpsG [Actibacterium lipolyticum]SMX44736.1 Phosphomannomutase/phosphoglucomutase [Actibacterium lipolyticum]
MNKLSCFKSYDVRGQLGINFDEPIAYRIGRGFARAMEPGTVVVGRDSRASSETLMAALIDGLRDEGVDVIDLGLCGTEEVYFATTHFATGGGLTVTASHNPINFNGIKMVQEGSRPISQEDGLRAIHDLAAADSFGPAKSQRGKHRTENPREAYAARVLSFADGQSLRPLRILVNAGNGAAGPTFDAIAKQLEKTKAPLEFIRMHHTPDGSFPNGIPNPLLLENQPVTSTAVLEHKADLGVAWDGDFDRCFLFDEKGAFVDGEYIVGLLAAAFLRKEPGAKIVHDPRVLWNTRSVVSAGGGQAVASKTGHAFMKQTMRTVDAVYGGEMSAHHYFRNFMYCDSGMIPWLLVAEHMSTTGQPLSALIAQMRDDFPSSGEINFRVDDPAAAIGAVETCFAAKAKTVDHLDGLSMEFDGWRLNLRKSNTEALLRLNVETAGDTALLKEKVGELSAIIDRAG